MIVHVGYGMTRQQQELVRATVEPTLSHVDERSLTRLVLGGVCSAHAITRRAARALLTRSLWWRQRERTDDASAVVDRVVLDLQVGIRAVRAITFVADAYDAAT
jgi:hypothetical protein